MAEARAQRARRWRPDRGAAAPQRMTHGIRSTCADARARAARVRLPGSKSISNRTLLLAALAEGDDASSRDVLDSDDTRACSTRCARSACGVERDARGEALRITGIGAARASR